jgi:hypothetical protein
MRLAFGLAAVLALSACASVAPSPPPAAPDFSEITPMAAPARTVLYTDCLAQAIERPAVARLSRGKAELLRFTCTGAPAQRFYEALAVLGDSAVSVWKDGERTFRATALVKDDLFGIDYCSTSPANDPVCQIVLNTGAFLTARN